MRYPPIPKNEWTEAQRAVAEAIVSGPRGELKGPFVPLLYTPEIAGPVQALGEAIRFKTGIPDRLLEIAVLMTARHLDCPNIWESHERLGAKAGLSRELMAAIARRETPAALDPDAALVHTVAKALLEGGRIPQNLFEEATSRFGRKGAMEIAAICGYYSMLAHILNAAERPLADPASVPFGVL